jgi:hypothetical protein
MEMQPIFEYKRHTICYLANSGWDQQEARWDCEKMEWYGFLDREQDVDLTLRWPRFPGNGC